MPEFPGNSRHEKTSEIEIEPVSEVRAERVVFDEVIRREQSIGTKLLNLASGVFKGLAHDVLIPALKDTARDFVNQGIDRALYRDEDRPPPRRNASSHHPRIGTTVHTPYDRMSREARDEPRSYRDRRRREPFRVDEVILRTQAQAESVLSEMYRILDKYDAVSIADLHHVLGQDELATSADENWGWIDLTGARFRRISQGYLLVFPELDDLK